MRQSATMQALKASARTSVSQPAAGSDSSAPPMSSMRSTRRAASRDIIAAARAATVHRGRFDEGSGSDDNETADQTDERPSRGLETRRGAMRGDKISLSEMLKQARTRGESTRTLTSTVMTASRAELEYLVQLNEREILAAMAALEKESAQVEKLKAQVERCNQELEDQRTEMAHDAAEILRLRRFKEETVKAKFLEAKRAPSEDAWTKLRNEQANLTLREQMIEESLRSREKQLASGEAEVRARMDEIAERERAANAKADAAAEASNAAMEAAAAAEAFLQDATNNKRVCLASSNEPATVKRLLAQGPGGQKGIGREMGEWPRAGTAFDYRIAHELTPCLLGCACALQTSTNCTKPLGPWPRTECSAYTPNAKAQHGGSTRARQSQLRNPRR